MAGAAKLIAILKAYHPEEKRAPKGDARGGQWISDETISTPTAITPVVDHLKADPTSRADAKATLALIDKVHGDGDLPPFAISKVEFRGEVAADGVFQPLVKPGPREAQAYLAYSRYSKDKYNTITHEFGHFLDAHEGGTEWGDKISSVWDAKFASDDPSTEFGKIVTAAQETPTIKTLQAWATAGEMQRHNVTVQKNGKPITVTVYGNVKHANYLTKPTEIFARAYNQYIATRSRSSKLTTNIKKAATLAKGTYGLVGSLPTQWSETEFEPIAKMFDAYFEKKGWKK